VHVYGYLMSHALGRPSLSQPTLVHHVGQHPASRTRPHLQHRTARVRALVGSRTVDGPAVYTPLVVLTSDDRVGARRERRAGRDQLELVGTCCAAVQTELA
jgi:hypothetical protein